MSEISPIATTTGCPSLSPSSVRLPGKRIVGPLKLARGGEGPSRPREFPPQVEVVATSSVEYNDLAIAIASSSRIDEESRELLPPLFHGARRRRCGFICSETHVEAWLKRSLGFRIPAIAEEEIVSWKLTLQLLHLLYWILPPECTWKCSILHLPNQSLRARVKMANTGVALMSPSNVGHFRIPEELALECR